MTLWFLENSSAQAVAYDDATLERDASLDIELGIGTGSWQGGFSDGTTLWFVDNIADFARAYVAATRVRDAANDIDLGSDSYRGGLSDGTTLWLVNDTTDTAVAYVAATRVRDAAKDISLGTRAWRGGLSDGTTLWFVNDTSDTAVAYVAATRVRDAAKDIALGTGSWQGGASDGTTLWVINVSVPEVVAYAAATLVRDGAKDIDLSAGNWTGGIHAAAVPPPVTGGVTVSVDGVDASDDVLGSPPVVTQRGSTRRADPFVPQVDSAELTLRSAAPVEDGVAIAVRQVNPARTLFSGTVAEAQNRDSLASNLASIRAVGPLAALSTPGPSVALMTAPLVSEAVEALLEACGIVAAERAIEASTRRLSLFWLASTAQPIRILQQLVATDGPGARLYVDGAGQVRYEPDGTRSTQGRSTAVQATYDAAARVTSVPAARNVSVQYQAENPQALTVTVANYRRHSGSSPRTFTLNPAPTDGDMLVVAGSGDATVRLGDSGGSVFDVYRRPGAASYEPFVAYHVWRDGDPTTIRASGYVDRLGLGVDRAILGRRCSGGRRGRAGGADAWRSLPAERRSCPRRSHRHCHQG